jgi:hypothetical protein
MLARSPFYRRVRDRMHGQVRFVARPPDTLLVPLSIARGNTIPYLANLGSWRALEARLGDVDVRAISAISAPGSIGYLSAAWLADRVLDRALAPGDRLVLREALCCTLDVTSTCHEPNHELITAHAMTFGGTSPSWSVTAPFRILERHVGTSLAVSSLVAYFATASTSAPDLVPAHVAKVLDGLGVRPAVRTIAVDLVVAIGVELTATQSRWIVSLRRRVAGLPKRPRPIGYTSRPRDAIIDAIQQLGATLTSP